MLHETLVRIITPSLMLAIIASSVELPGSMFRLLMRSMGARFQLAERVVATPSSPGRWARARVASDTALPSGRREDAALDQQRALRRLAFVVEAEAGELFGPRRVVATFSSSPP